VIPGIVVTAVGTAGLLVAERLDRPRLRRVFKPLASAGFLLAAVRAPAFTWPVGMAWLLLVGLVLSAAGDVLLVPKSKTSFVLGMASFGLAHVAYGAWFLSRGVSAWVFLPIAAVFLVIGHLVWRWLDTHVTGGLRLPVRGYVGLVSLMAASALAYGAHAIAADPAPATVSSLTPIAPAVGGVLFYLSDLAVARHRFITPAFINRAWGLPVYYLAQLLIASALA
jgi:uncharacterized membrane protein YhhN